MEFNLTNKQALAYLLLTESNITELGYGGAAGGGKSFLGCFWILSMCIRYPGTTWLIGRKELSNLKKTTLLSFFKVLDTLGMKSSDYMDMNSQTNIIHLHNKSKIFLMDMAHQPSDPLYTRFGGLELTGAFVDESNENEVQAIEIIKTRIGRCKNEEYKITPKILETFNPSKNHVYYRYYKPFRDKQMPKNRLFIPALAIDNPYLDATYINQLKNADKITRERLLNGNFDYDDDPSKIFDYDKILDIFLHQVNILSKDQKYISCDVARFGDDLTVVIVWHGFHILEIKTMNKSSMQEVKELIESMTKKYQIPNSNIVIDEDGVGGGVIDFMKNVKGFINNSSPKETEFSKTIHNYKNLKTQCYFKLAEYVNQGKVSCYEVSNEIKDKIIEDLEQVAQSDIDKDEKKIGLVSKEDIKLKIGRSPDFGDAIMMRMLFELQGSYKPCIA